MGTVADGRDTYCLDALVPGRMASGLELLGQRCYRRLITPRGTLRGGEDEANFGLDLAGFVGQTEDKQLASMLPVVVQNELLKDPEVDAVKVTASRVDLGGKQSSWMLTVNITGTDGDVELVLAVSAVTVQLVGMS